MNVQISSPNFAITDSIKENLNRVIRKITLMNNQVQSVAVSLKKEGNEYIVILRAKMKGTNSTAVIKKRSQNFYTALASVYSTVLHTLKKK